MPTIPSERGFLPTIEVCKGPGVGGEEDPFCWKKTEYYKSMTSLVLERSARDSQSWVRECSQEPVISKCNNLYRDGKGMGLKTFQL